MLQIIPDSIVVDGAYIRVGCQVYGHQESWMRFAEVKIPLELITWQEVLAIALAWEEHLGAEQNQPELPYSD